MLSLCTGGELPSGNTGGNRTVTHFDKTALNIHRVLFSVHRRVTQRSRFQRRNNGRMPGENRKRTDHSRQCDNLHISVEYALFGRYYTQMQFFHHSIYLFFRLFQQFLTFLYCLLNGSDIQESLFGKIIHFSFQNHLESLDGIFNTHHHTRNACKLFSHGKRL